MGTQCGPDNQRFLRFNPLSGKASSPNATEFSFLTSLPSAKYSRVSEFLRKATSGDGQCKLFCGGKKCKYENGETHWTEDQMAIKGLYSTWITDQVMAIARPNTINILKYDMIGQFKRFNIKTIINLQKPGEHPYCGHGLVDSAGFSYDPQLFMDNGIYHYNFGWDDYGVTSISTLLDMVRVFKFATEEGKVAVHCHAGLGRTGVLITCFLVFHWRISANRAIQQMRMNRPQAVQTRQQMACVRSFAAFLRPLQVIYPHQHLSIPYEFTLTQFLRRQRHLLHGLEARYLHHIPKLIFVVGQRIVGLVGAAPHPDSPWKAAKPAPADMETLIPRAFQESRDRRRKKDSKEGLGVETQDDDNDNNDDDEDDDAKPSTPMCPGFDGIVALNSQDGTGGSLVVTRSESLGAASPNPSVFEAKHEFRQIKSGKTTPEVGFAETSMTLKGVRSLGKLPPQNLSINATTAADRDSSNLPSPKSSKFFGFDADANSFRQQSPSGNSRQQSSSGNPRQTDGQLPSNSDDAKFTSANNAVDDDDLPRGSAAAAAKSGKNGANRPQLSASVNATTESAITVPWEEVADALIKMRVVVTNGNAEEEGVAKVMNRVSTIAKSLNESDSGWDEIESLTDPLLLSGLLWSWIEQLKEPILTRQDLNVIVSASSKPMEKILRNLDRGTRETIKHLVSIFAFMETGKSRRRPIESQPPSVPVERLHLLLHLAEQLCHQDFTQPIKEFMDEAIVATALERNAELSSTALSSTFASSTNAAFNGNRGRHARRSRDVGGGGGVGVPSLDRRDAVVVVMFVYRLFLFVGRTHDLITDFDGDATYEQIVDQLFQIVRARTDVKA